MPALDKSNLNDPVLAHVSHEFTTLDVQWTVGEALQSLRSPTLAERVVYLYVVERDFRLVGVVPTRKLLMSAPDQKIAEIMLRDVVSVPRSMTVLEACELFVMHRLLAFPVVDRENRVLGVVDVNLFTDEIFDVSARQSNQDVFQLIGIHIARGRTGSPWSQFRDRFPWLLCNIAGGLACAFIMGMYEQFLNARIVLALFVPVVLTLSEGVSIQSMTITLQAFHEEGVDWRSVFRSLRVELFAAALLGMACGATVGLIAWAWKHQPAVGFVLGVSICLAITTACLLGVILPTIVHIVRGDPRIAAGPVVLASADVATLLFFFNLSRHLLP